MPRRIVTKAGVPGEVGVSPPVTCPGPPQPGMPGAGQRAEWMPVWSWSTEPASPPLRPLALTSFLSPRWRIVAASHRSPR